jgi:hypothetical protein
MRQCFLLGGFLIATCVILGQQATNDGPPTNGIVELNRRLALDQARLVFEPQAGYLRSVLQALAVPVESQIVVFSKTSLMQKIITPQNPRTLYFNDEIAVGWVHGEPFVEVAAADLYEGIVFTLWISNRLQSRRSTGTTSAIPATRPSLRCRFLV